MGCCEGSSRVYLKDTFISTSKNDNQFMEAFGHFYVDVIGDETDRLIEFFRIKNWGRLYDCSQRQDLIKTEKLELPVSTDFRPRLMGELALMLLMNQAKKDPQSIAQVIFKRPALICSNLLKPLEICNQSIFLLLSIIDYGSEDLKEQLVKNGIFNNLVESIKSDESKVRMASAELASRIYAENLDRKMDFFDRKGEFALVQLIKWEEDDDDSLCSIFSAILELVCVSYK